MSCPNKIKYKEIDKLTVTSDKLSQIIDKYHDLDYFVEVILQGRKGISGFYDTEYIIKILKPVEELEE